MPDRPLRVGIVGAGFSGIGAAIELRRDARRLGGVEVTVFERDESLGGTWWANTYPGCACDIPSQLYSFSFFPNPGWTRVYPSQPEILDYLERCADHFGIRPLIRFGTEIVEARWDDSAATWTLRTAGGEEHVFDVVVIGSGPLSRPSVPDLPGLGSFAGTVFHTARWRHDHALAGERVAVIGTGASAIQVVPEIAATVERLDVYQRTAPWVVPRNDRELTDDERDRFRRHPLLQRLARWRVWFRQELLVAAFLGSDRSNRKISQGATAFIAAQVPDPELRASVTPAYRPGCKRLLISNDWYPALGQPNVQLVTDPIAEVRKRSIVAADGTERQVDTIVLATGFAANRFLAPMRVHGRDGVELNESWRSGAATYLGTMVHGFPNLFLLVGPGTGLGHNSIVFMIESQLKLVRAALVAMRRPAPGAGAGSRVVEIAEAEQRRSYERHQRKSRRTVWMTGCSSWYLSEDGRNELLWPATTVEYWLRTRRVPRRRLLVR